MLNLLYLLVMTLIRVSALLTYGDGTLWTWAALTQGDLLKMLFMGARFDSVILGYLAVFPSLLLSALLPWGQERLFASALQILKFYYSILFFVVAALLILDVGYYSYFQDHFNVLVFGLVEDDTWALMRTFWKNYPVLGIGLVTALGFCLLHLFHRWIFRPLPTLQNPEKVPGVALPAAVLALLSVVFMTARGSFGLFPLGPADTVISQNPFLNHLTSNGIHALYRAVKLRRQSSAAWDNNLKNFGYNDPRQAFADFYSLPLEQVPADPLQLFHQKTANNTWAEKTKPHVVVVMMESFGGHWLKYQSPEFNLLGQLQSHFDQDLLLKNFLPSASSTTGSLSSLMISAPLRPAGNFLTESEYLQVPFRSSPARIFSKAGYETHFVYGGNPGWRDMNKFARFQGFDHVEGDVNMEAKLGPFKERHDWGIYDEDVFRFVQTLLEEATKPQMILIMTTTNHPPYQTPSTFQAPAQKIPPELRSRLVGDSQIFEARFKTYFYSNDCLGKFISQVKSSPLAEKTLLAATGDHGFLLINFNDQELLQKWSVPFYLYTPKAIRPLIDPKTFGSHMDIFPTLYNLALSDAEYDALGVNLADANAPHYAFHSSGLAVGPAGGALLQGKDGNAYFDWQGTSQEPYQKLTPGSETPEKKIMGTRYKSLMSLLDYYFMTEKKSEKPNRMTQ